MHCRFCSFDRLLIHATTYLDSLSYQEQIDVLFQNVAFEYLISGLWAIVNNAGFNVMGDVEWLTVPLYHKAMNVNFYGAVRVTRAFLYLVRRAKGK